MSDGDAVVVRPKVAMGVGCTDELVGLDLVEGSIDGSVLGSSGLKMARLGGWCLVGAW